jgi:hypothetical protein
LPIRPLEALVKYRTGSMYCRVGPEVIRMRATLRMPAPRETETNLVDCLSQTVGCHVVIGFACFRTAGQASSGTLRR